MGLEIKKAEKADWWYSFSEAEKESIEKGTTDAEESELKPHSEIPQLLNQYKFLP